MIRQERADFVREYLDNLYPEVPIPLSHSNNYTLLVAVLLSAQCTDERVNKVTPTLFAKADNPQKMLSIEIDEIYKIIRLCGLAPQKSSAIHNLSKILVEEHNSEVPNNFEDLEKLPL